MIEKNVIINREENKQFPLVDIIKFICAILVVSVHFPLFSSIDANANFVFRQYIARIAVPFFFVSSSYFCFRKTNEKSFDIKITNKYSFRMLKLYVLWFIIYMIPVVILNKFSIKCLKDFLTGYSHLWYLKAAAFAFFVTGFLLYKRINIKKILIISGILYLIGLLGQTYYGTLFNIKHVIPNYYTRNGIFEGFFFVALGAFMTYKPIKIKNVTAIFALIVSAILWGIETILVRKFKYALDYNMSIFMIPTVYFLFYIAINITKIKIGKTKNLRKLSMYIYYLHMLVATYILPIAYKLILYTTKIKIRGNNSLIKFSMVVVISLIISAILVKLSETKGFKWLKALS